MNSLKTLLHEGRYDSLVTRVSNRVLDAIKRSYSSVTHPTGQFVTTDVDGETKTVTIHYKQPADAPEIRSDDENYIFFLDVDNQSIPLQFKLGVKVQWVDNLQDYRYGGDTFNSTRRHDTEDFPFIELRFEIDPADYPFILHKKIAFSLRDVLRHEMEHLTQSGWNTIDSKFMPSDMSMRKKIDAGTMPPWKYFILPKEIDANLQGLYLSAKKRRVPMQVVVDEYLNIFVDEYITLQEKQHILDAWRTRLPALGIRQEI
jgi:hypothetical protein